MAKTVSAAVQAQIDADRKKPVLLFQLELLTTVRFAATKYNITWNGFTWTAKTATISNMSQALEGQVERITCRFDNVLRDMAAYAQYQDLQGRTLTVYRIFRDAMAAADYIELFNGSMERPKKIGREWMELSATAGKSLTEKFHSRMYQRLCPWIFGGTECDTDGNADLTDTGHPMTDSGTCQSGGTTFLVENGLTQGNDHWKYGTLKLVKGGVEYWRVVRSSDGSATRIDFDVAVPFTCDSSVTYQVWKGCAKTWTNCTGAGAPGPSANNKANFGGCIHIGEETEPE